MNGKDLMEGIGFVNGKYIEEAETMAFPGTGKIRHFSGRRLVQIGMAAALALMLVGCAVAYVLSIKDMKVGDEEVTMPVYNEYLEFQGNETIPLQVLSLSGIKGSDSYRATQEWFSFMQSYDPDRKIQGSVWGNYPEFPEEYAAYAPYSQEMVDKIDVIADKYSLKLVGAPVELHSGRRFYQELGIDSLLMPDSRAQISVEHANGYEGGSFMVTLFYMNMPEGSGQWPYRMTNMLYFNKKDCFNPYTMSIGEENWTEWTYTTASGYPVLLMRSEGLGWIICDREDATMAIRVELSREAWSQDEGKTWSDTVYMTDRQFEMVADAFDFTVEPHYQGAVNAFEGVDPSNHVQTQNGYTIALKSALSDGRRAVITLAVTAPEGVDLTRVTREGYEEEGLGIFCGNDFFEALTRKGQEGTHTGSGTHYVQEDGDGLANTQDIVIEMNLDNDGEPCFAPGEVWTLFWEDLRATCWDNDKNQETVLWSVEGNWIFDFTFEGDFRAREMIREPVTVNVPIGWDYKGDDVYGDAVIESFLLRSMSATVTFREKSGDLSDYKNEKYVAVVMKDGTEVTLHESSQSFNVIIMDAESPIDPDQVDHVRLVDGTKLMISNS